MEALSIEDLATRYRMLLADEGYKVDAPEKDRDGDFILSAKIEGVAFLAIFHSEDQEFVRLLIPNLYTLDSDDLKLNALVAINHVGMLIKGVKVHMTPGQDDVYATVEYLDHGSSVNFKTLLRYIRMLDGGAREFIKKMEELK